MATIYDKLEAKIAYHTKRAEALQIALDDLRGDAAAKAKASLNGNLSKAIALRRGRGTPAKRATPAKLAPGNFLEAALFVLNQAKAPLTKTALRERIAERLGRKISGVGFGSLIRYGYAKLIDGAYIGTGKQQPEA